MEAKYFERGKCLGEGAFGKVFLCFHKKEPGKKVHGTSQLDKFIGKNKWENEIPSLNFFLYFDFMTTPG